MPATRLDRSRRREPLRELIAGRMAVIGMTTPELGEKLGWSRASAFNKIKNPDDWKLSEVKKAARVLGVSIEELRERITY